MNNFKLVSYLIAFFSGIILIFLIDFDQPSKSVSTQKSTNITSQINTSEPVASIPANWTSIRPSSSMRDKEYVIKNSIGEFNLIVFKNIGGSTEQNITRWINQFSGDENPLLPFQKREIEQSGKNFIYIQNSGYFNGGMGQTEAFDNAGLIAFIVEDRSDIYYYKAVASVETLLESKEQIITTILSTNL